MKSRLILLLNIILLYGMIVGWVYYKSYYNRLEQLEHDGKKAFVEALDEELKKRELEGTHSLVVKASLYAEVPDSVYLVNSYGKRTYKLDPEKHSGSIIHNLNVGILQSASFDKEPLQPDSLNLIWQKKLLEKGISMQSALQIIGTNRNDSINIRNTTRCDWCNEFKPLFSTYIGSCCEIEAICYLHYSLWDLSGFECFIYLLLYLIFVYCTNILILSIWKKATSARQIEVREVKTPVIIKKVDETVIHSYQMGKNLIFYAEQKRISNEETDIKITSQICTLLEFLLNANNYQVTDDEIMDKLWPDGSGTMERVQKAIGRLRSALSGVDSSITIARKEGTKYQLLISIDEAR